MTPAELGVASDLFALGLISTEFLTGSTPPFDAATYHEPAVAVRSGETLTIPRTGIAPAVADLADAMLSADPARGHTIAQVHSVPMALRPPARDEVPTSPTPSASSTPTALRGKGVHTGLRARATGSTAPSQLVGKLLKKFNDRGSSCASGGVGSARE